MRLAREGIWFLITQTCKLLTVVVVLKNLDLTYCDAVLLRNIRHWVERLHAERYDGRISARKHVAWDLSLINIFLPLLCLRQFDRSTIHLHAESSEVLLRQRTCNPEAE